MQRKPSISDLARLRGLWRQHPRYQGCVGHWLLHEGGGTTVNDASGHANHGTFVNQPVWTVDETGTALAFDATDDYIDTGIVPDPSSGTIAARFRTPTTGQADTFGCVFGQQSASALRTYFFIRNTTEVALCGFDSATANAGPALNDGLEHTVILIWGDGSGNATVWLDGVAIHTFTDDGVHVWPQSVFLGGHNRNGSPEGSRFLQGNILEARIYTRAWRPAEARSFSTEPYVEFTWAARLRRMWVVEQVVAGGRIMASLAGEGGLAGRGGIAGPGGGLAA